METNTFSNETLNAAVNAMNEYQTEIDQLRELVKNGPTQEVAQRYLMDKLSMTQSEAEEICDNIQSGILEFDTQFQANSNNGRVDLRTKLEEVTADMDEEKRIDYLSAVLTAFQATQQQTISPEQISELQTSNATHPANEIINDIEVLFNDKFPVDNLADFVNTSLDTNAIIDLSHRINMSKEEYRFLVALMLYVGQEEGKFKFSDSEEPLSANMLGALASAGIETISLTGELKEGKIDLRRWQTILKWILGALVGCALVYIAFIAIAFVAGFVGGLIFFLLGEGTIALFVALLIAVFVCWDMSKYLEGGIKALLDVLSSIYDQYIEPITQKTNAWAVMAQEWFASLFNKSETKTETSSKSEGEITNPTIAVQPGVVMA